MKLLTPFLLFCVLHFLSFSVIAQGISDIGENVDYWIPNTLEMPDIFTADSMYLGAPFLRDTTKRFVVSFVNQQAGCMGSLYLVVPDDDGGSHDIFIMQNHLPGMDSDGNPISQIRGYSVDLTDSIAGKVHNLDTVYFKYVNEDEACPPRYSGPNRSPNDVDNFGQPLWQATDRWWCDDSTTIILPFNNFAAGHRFCVAGWVLDSVTKLRTDAVQFGFEDLPGYEAEAYPPNLGFDDIIFNVTGLFLIREERLEDIQLMPHDTIMVAGQTLLFSGTVNGYDQWNTRIQVPNDTVDEHLKWAIISNRQGSLHPATFSNGNGPSHSNSFTATEVGTYTIAVTYIQTINLQTGGTRTDTLTGERTLRVIPGAANRITIEPSAYSDTLIPSNFPNGIRLTIGTSTITAYSFIRDQYNNLIGPAGNANWAIANTNIAVVAPSNGSPRGTISRGPDTTGQLVSTLLTVTAGVLTASLDVVIFNNDNYTDISLKNIVLTPPETTVTAGDTVSFRATVYGFDSIGSEYALPADTVGKYLTWSVVSGEALVYGSGPSNTNKFTAANGGDYSIKVLYIQTTKLRNGSLRTDTLPGGSIVHVKAEVSVVSVSTHEWLPRARTARDFSDLSNPLSVHAVLKDVFGVSPADIAGTYTVPSAALALLASQGYPPRFDGYLDYLDLALSEPMMLDASCIVSIDYTHTSAPLTRRWALRKIITADNSLTYRLWLTPTFIGKPSDYADTLETGMKPVLVFDNIRVAALNNSRRISGSSAIYETPASLTHDSAAPVIAGYVIKDNTCNQDEKNNTIRIFMSEPVARPPSISLSGLNTAFSRIDADSAIAGIHDSLLDGSFISITEEPESINLVYSENPGNLPVIWAFSLELAQGKDTQFRLGLSGIRLNSGALAGQNVSDLLGNNCTGADNRKTLLSTKEPGKNVICNLMLITYAEQNDALTLSWSSESGGTETPLFPWWGFTLVNPTASNQTHKPPDIRVSNYIFDLLGNLVANPSSNPSLIVVLDAEKLFGNGDGTYKKFAEFGLKNLQVCRSQGSQLTGCGLFWNALNRKGRLVAPGGYVVRMILSNGIDPVIDLTDKLVIGKRRNMR